MPYVIQHVLAQDIVEVTYTGVATGADLREATAECVVLQKQKGVTRFLLHADVTDMTASLEDVYELPTKQYFEQGVSGKSRIAIVRPAAARARELAEYFESLCSGRSWHVRMFPDRESAIQWLTAPSVS